MNINPTKLLLFLGSFLLLITSGCLAQKRIELACYQTLTASTPICMCNQSNENNKVLETAPASSPLQSDAETIVLFPSVTPLPPPPFPNPNDYIFKADFESGDLSAYTYPSGEHFGKGVFSDEGVTTNPAIGKYSAAITIGSGTSSAAYLFSYRVPTTQLGYYSADYYIPGNIVPDSWWNVWQWKSRNEIYSKPTIDLNVLNDNGLLHVYMNYVPGGDPQNPTKQIIQDNPITFPTDQWVNLTGYYMSKSDDSGYVLIYQDGVKIFEMRDIQTKPGNEDIFWSVNSYADKIFPNPATIYVDNVSVAEMQLDN
jgi:hypothetical protein